MTIEQQQELVDGPAVSVICVVYNGAKYVQAAIESIAQQTLMPKELIVVDDGSTDDSIDIVQSLDLPFQIKVIRQQNRGQSAARNVGVSNAHGRYIAFIDQDDIWYARHLELLCAQLSEEQNIAWAFCNLDHVDETGRYIGFNIFDYMKVKHPKTNLMDILGSDVFVLPSASVIRRDAFNAVGGFDENLSGYEDDDLFLRVFQRGYRSAYIQESLAAWRIHSKSASYSLRMDRSRRIYVEKLIGQFPNCPRLQYWWVRDLIAPRFYMDAYNRYMVGLEEEDWERCALAHEDMQLLANHLKRNFRSLVRSVKLTALSKPRLLRFLRSSRSVRNKFANPASSTVAQFKPMRLSEAAQ